MNRGHWWGSDDERAYTAAIVNLLKDWEDNIIKEILENGDKMSKQVYILIAGERKHEDSALDLFNVMSFYGEGRIESFIRNGHRVFTFPQLEEVTEATVHLTKEKNV